MGNTYFLDSNILNITISFTWTCELPQPFCFPFPYHLHHSHSLSLPLSFNSTRLRETGVSTFHSFVFTFSPHPSIRFQSSWGFFGSVLSWWGSNCTILKRGQLAAVGRLVFFSHSSDYGRCLSIWLICCDGFRDGLMNINQPLVCRLWIRLVVSNIEPIISKQISIQ